MNKCLATTFIVSFLMFPGLLQAQKSEADADDGPVGVFQSRSEYHRFMGDIKSNPETRGMTNLINDLVLGQDFGTTSATYKSDGMLGLLADPSVRKDLEMLDYQYEDLKAGNAELLKQAGEQLKGADLSDTEKFMEQVRMIESQTREKMTGGLLPHQLQRLQQIQAQRQLTRRTLIEVITSDPLKTEFEISDDQAEQLRESEQQIMQELEQQIAELRSRAQQQLLSGLDEQQREQVEEMFGEPMERPEAGRQRQKRDGQKEGGEKQRGEKSNFDK